MRKLSPDRTLIAKRGKLRAYVFAAELRKMLHAGQPCRGPTQGFNQLARQAERQIETADPVAGLRKPLAEAGQGVETQDASKCDCLALAPALGQHDGLAPARAAGKVAAEKVWRGRGDFCRHVQTQELWVRATGK